LRGSGGLNDVARLERRWRGRLEKDEELKKKAVKLQEQEQPPPLPPLEIGGDALPREATTARGDESASGAPPAAVEPALADDLWRWTALEAELAALPHARTAVLARHGVASEEELATLSAGWQAKAAADPALAADLRRLVEHGVRRAAVVARRARSRTVMEQEAREAAALESARGPRSSRRPATLEMRVADLPPPLPFVAGKPAAAPARSPRSPRTGERKGGTEPELAAKQEPALPFARTGASAPAPNAPVPGAPVASVPLASVSAPSAPVPGAPVASVPVASVPVASMPVANVPPSGRAAGATPAAPSAAAPPSGAKALQVTAPLQGIPRAALPFRDDAPRVEARASPAPAPIDKLRSTAPVREAPKAALPFDAPAKKKPRSELGETSLGLAVPRDLIAKLAADRPRSDAPASAPPSARTAAASPSAPPVASATPRAVSAPPVAVEAPLPLERHASLRAELALMPTRSDQVLKRYQVSSDLLERADRYWQRRIAEDPTVGAAWHRAYRTYAEWLATQRRPR
jgi:hypothetical protein